MATGEGPLTRLRRMGAAACQDDELLAVLVGGRQPLVTARRLLADTGGISALGRSAELSADHPRVAAAVELGRRAAAAWPAPRWQLRTPADLAERLMPSMGHLEREELRVALLNAKHTVTHLATVYAGNLSSSPVRVGEVFCEAVRRQAAAIVVVHNHPSGDPAPSPDDLRITVELAEAGALLDVELLDHLVIGHGRWVSLRALGCLPGAAAVRPGLRRAAGAGVD